MFTFDLVVDQKTSSTAIFSCSSTTLLSNNWIYICIVASCSCCCLMIWYKSCWLRYDVDEGIKDGSSNIGGDNIYIREEQSWCWFPLLNCTLNLNQSL